MPIGKSAARLYREYKAGGGTLPFNNWLNREKAKFMSADGSGNTLTMIDTTLNSSVQSAIQASLVSGGLKPQSGNTIFGINKWIFITGAVLVTAAAIYLIRKHNQST